MGHPQRELGSFQFLGIPPKGEQENSFPATVEIRAFPISRDPPEGGTETIEYVYSPFLRVSNF